MREKMIVLLVDAMDRSISYLLEKYFESSGLDSGSKLNCIGNVIKEVYTTHAHTPDSAFFHEYSMILTIIILMFSFIVMSVIYQVTP